MAGRIEIIQGDITTVEVDAIVNAANETLLGGGGVDGAIHRAAGPELLAECRVLGGCPTGEARITGAYRLPSKHVIHTVGPIYQDGRQGEAELLGRCYRNCIALAAEHQLETLAFPAISCGVYGYPLNDAGRIAIDAVVDSMSAHGSVDSVTFVLFSNDVRLAFERALD